MTGFAATPREARQAFVSVYPFELANGGLGVLLTATDSSQVATLVGDGGQALITNKGAFAGHLFFGIGTGIAATEACLCILPGIPYTLTISADATHVAYIALGGDTKIQITRGYGN